MEEPSFEHKFFVQTQIEYDRCHFIAWCYNLCELNEKLYEEITLNHNLYEYYNRYFLRSYFVLLWEIIYDGKKYIDRQDKIEEPHLISTKKLIDELLSIISDDDYFMIKYYRNCASHIFLTSYSVLDKDDKSKAEDKQTTFYYKNGEKYPLTHKDIIDKVTKVFGSRDGIKEEPNYKKKLIGKLYPIIHKYNIETTKIDDEINKMIRFISCT